MTVPFLKATVVQGQVVITIEGGAAPSAIVRLSPSRATEISAHLGALALDAIEDEAKIVEEDIARLEAELAARRTALARMQVYVPKNPGDLRSDLADAPPTDQLQRDTSGARAAIGSDRLPAILDAILDRTIRPVIVIADAVTLADVTRSITYAMIEEGDPALSVHPTIEEAREARLFYTSGNRCPVHFCSMPHSFLSRPAKFALIVNAGRHRLNTDEGNLFQLAEKRTYSFIGGKIVMFFDVNDTHIAEASRQYAKARVFRLPFTEPGS